MTLRKISVNSFDNSNAMQRDCFIDRSLKYRDGEISLRLLGIYNVDAELQFCCCRFNIISLDYGEVCWRARCAQCVARGARVRSAEVSAKKLIAAPPARFTRLQELQQQRECTKRGPRAEKKALASRGVESSCKRADALVWESLRHRAEDNTEKITLRRSRCWKSN